MVRGLLLVAHPDDETFFAGSTLIQTPGILWDIVCMTHGRTEERGQRCADARYMLSHAGANIYRNYMLGMGDPVDNPVPPVWWFERARSALLEEICPNDYDIVLTHNRRGEYGHPHHVTANSVARSLFTNVWEFHHPYPSGVGPQWRGEHIRQFAHSRKEEALMVYLSELNAFCDHYPTLGSHIRSHMEMVTGDGRWPL